MFARIRTHKYTVILGISLLMLVACSDDDTPASGPVVGLAGSAGQVGISGAGGSSGTSGHGGGIVATTTGGQAGMAGSSPAGSGGTAGGGMAGQSGYPESWNECLAKIPPIDDCNICCDEKNNHGNRTYFFDPVMAGCACSPGALCEQECKNVCPSQGFIPGNEPDCLNCVSMAIKTKHSCAQPAIMSCNTHQECSDNSQCYQLCLNP
jgi:hypothetical protein